MSATGDTKALMLFSDGSDKLFRQWTGFIFCKLLRESVDLLVEYCCRVHFQV